MKIFDSHTHIYPEKIAERASAGIGDFYDMPIRHAGTAADLIKKHKSAGVCGALICSVATNVPQIGSINDFILQSVKDSGGFFVGFASLHPDMTELELDSEINRAISNRLCGVKLHPDIQRFAADGKRAHRLFEVLDDRLPVLLHAGDTRFDFSSPKRVARLISNFTKQRVIAAHLGGWSDWDNSILELSGKHENLWVDTCSSFYAMSPEKAKEYIRAFGEERVLFGTDYPMWNIREELELFDKIDLTQTQREKILYGNAQKLLKFD